MKNKEVISEIMSSFNEIKIFSDDELKWIYSILIRQEKNQDGIVQLGPLIEQVYHALKAPSDMAEYQKYLVHKKIRDNFEYYKNTIYVQKRILVAAPQRIRHLPEGSSPPHLHGLVVPQSVYSQCLPVFGLSHDESRNYFVNYAIKNDFHYILFTDEDQLIPIDVIKTLLAYDLDAVSALYVKKNPVLETVATVVRPSNNDKIFDNYEVECLHPSDSKAFEPVAVNSVGLGCALVKVSALKVLPQPVFSFQFSAQGQPLVGEDSVFARNMMRAGTPVYVIPGIVSPHCAFQESKEQGKTVLYGPTWLVDPKTKSLRSEYVEKYTKFSVPPGTLYHPYDNPTSDGRYNFPDRAPPNEQ